MQNVEHEHKSSIKERENKTIVEAEQNIKTYFEKESNPVIKEKVKNIIKKF